MTLWKSKYTTALMVAGVAIVVLVAFVTPGGADWPLRAAPERTPHSGPDPPGSGAGKMAAAAARTAAGPGAPGPSGNELTGRLNQLAEQVDRAHNRLETLQVEVLIAVGTDPHERVVFEKVRAAGLPDRVAQAIVLAARAYDVPTRVIVGLITVESGWRAQLVHLNRDGSRDYGLMQLNDRTWPHLAAALGLDAQAALDPEHNVAMGIYHLGYLKQKYGDWHNVLTAYNRGERGLQDYISNRGTGESTYSRQVLAVTPTRDG